MKGPVRAPVAALAEGERALDTAASHYLVHVLRLAAGARFVAFDPERAIEADAEIVQSTRDVVTARFGATRAASVVARRKTTWIHAIAKGDKTDAIVRDATELGATLIVLAFAERSVVKLDLPRARAKLARWTTIAREAARQSGRADAPEIDGPHPWIDALARAPLGARFCLHPSPDAPRLGPLLASALASDAPLAFAAGPEGGLTLQELEAAERAGFRVVSLGPFVLRTETVPAAVLGAARVLDGI
jgi:16S rRNA (uracil1498-N3)-methyltransferase